MAVAKKAPAAKKLPTRKPPAAKKPKPSFWGQYEDEGGGGMYLSGDEKEILFNSQVPFVITSVTGPADTGYEGKTRMVLGVEIEGEPRLMSFDFGPGKDSQGVPSRDRFLLAVQEWLADEDNEPPTVVLDRKGRAWILRDPEAEE